MIRALAVAACALALAASPAGASGDDDDEPAGTPTQTPARQKFGEGNRKYAMGDYAGAEEAFKSAIQLDPDLPGPYRNLGLVYVATHKCEDAIARFEAYLKLRPASKHTARITAEIERCKGGAPSRVIGSGAINPAATEQALVTITASAGGKSLDGAVVRVDGLIRGGAPLDLQITPGHHTVRVERIGYDPGEAELEVRANATQELNVELGKPVVGEAPSHEPQRATRRPLAWALLGIAGAGFGVGAAFGILESANWQAASTLDRATHTRADLAPYEDRGKLYSALAYTGLGLGVASLAGAVVVFLLDGKRGEAHGEPVLAARPRPQISVGATLSGDGAGLSAVGTW